jgi:hypothetical protein
METRDNEAQEREAARPWQPHPRASVQALTSCARMPRGECHQRSNPGSVYDGGGEPLERDFAPECA